MVGAATMGRGLVFVGSQQSAAVADSIFVQIPAFRDQELWPTIRDLHSKAAHPDRLRIAVLWQRDTGSRAPTDVAELSGVEITEVDASDSEGPNWARKKLRHKWDG